MVKKSTASIAARYVDELVLYHLADSLMAAAQAVLGARRGEYLVPSQKAAKGTTRRSRANKPQSRKRRRRGAAKG